MDKSMIKGIALGGVAMVVLGAGAVGGYQTLAKPQSANVVSVKEVMTTVSTPREVCENVAVQHQAPVKDEHRVAGTVVGGLAGGLLGSTIGKGSGKTVATVAGAVAGGYAGNQVQKKMQQSDTVTSTERRCRTVQDKSQKLLGYDVTYTLDGQSGKVRTSYKPGATLPVKNGQIDTTPPSDAPAKAQS
ncbi:MAG: glycine zipper 2TM domain-containing protein [Hydrogenophaga sp.]|uniref:glycine zipper 2TM domain-containing protein n=1 Tax=Hydrogenophaga sp. TaxID=1904254 RepID=UPI001D88A44B|nr:glycine zipper 2TM domain-containing protein [Hydrogenophaga sp.]MBX3608518.1 glycine zipper 2TM domain-containing protein [Hydrogenophaga sp.]